MMEPSADPPPSSFPRDSRISSAGDDSTEYELNASGVRKRPGSNGSNHSASLVASGGPRHSHTSSSGSAGSSSSANNTRDPRRSSILSRAPSTGSNLRDTFFKTKSDPLEESSHNEFNLTIIDEEGVISKTPGDSAAVPSSSSSSSGSSWLAQWWRTEWSSAGYIVVGIAAFTVLVTYVATLLSPTLEGYEIDPGLVLGSLQTLILCAIVVITYHGVHIFQAHPNPLIYYKCIIDMALAMRFLLDPWLLRAGVYETKDRHSCAYLSGLTQVLYLTSDCWYFALIFDLYKSIKNPFTSVQADRKKYIAFVTVFGLASGVLTSSVSSFHGFADGNYCWTHRGDRQERNFWRLNVASWILFYDWMIVFYLSGIGVLIYGRRRLKSGLKLTLDSRLEMRRHSAISIMSFTAYWTIAFTWYAISFSARTHYEADGHMSPSKVFRSYSYTLAGRGVVDYFVWFMINKPSRMKAHWMKFSSESADHKFSAQLNTALQRELIFFTNEGMIRAVQLADDELLRKRERSPTQELVLDQSQPEDTESARGSAVSFETPSNAPVMSLTRAASDRTISMQDLEASSTTNTTSPTSDSNGVGPPRRSFLTYLGFSAPATASTSGSAAAKAPSVVASNVSTASASYTSEQSIKFTPYKSEAFAELRSACGIKTADFMASFEASTKPSISEGASGAFMFFSGDKRFIVKSMAEDECRFLCDIADAYVEYLITNPRSLITKFFGCFKITLYEKKFYFVVMENLFDVMEQGVTIHHRYDIKGSWVNRSYSRPRRGAKLKCRHCSMQFKYGAANNLQCPNVVGRHEPNVVLKDNDLRTRMRIGVDAGRELYETLREDSLFLCSLGIMDYSLLLGVTDIEFLVDQPTHSDRRNTVTSNPNASSSMIKPRTASGHSTSTHSTASAGGGGGEVPITRESLAMLDDGTAPLQRGSSSTIAGAGAPPPTYRAKSLASFHSSMSLSGSADAAAGSSSSLPSAGPPKHSMRKSERVFGPGFYYIGIIDILQQWNTKKRIERFWKVQVQRCDGNGLSAMDPVRYQRRFEAKLREIIAIPRDVHARASTPGHPQAVHGSNTYHSTRGGRVHSDGADAGGGGGRFDEELHNAILGGEDHEEELVDLEQGVRSNPQPILMRVGSHQRRANANANSTTASGSANVQAL